MVLKLIVVGRLASPLGNGQDDVLDIVRLLLCPDNFFCILNNVEMSNSEHTTLFPGGRIPKNKLLDVEWLGHKFGS